MIETVLELVHYGTTLVFGIYLSAAFLGIILNRRNILILLGYSFFVGMLNTFSYVLFDVEFTEQIYPLIIHLPLILFLKLFYKFRTVQAALAVFITYLCCQLSNWIGLLFLNYTHLNWVYYCVRNIVTVLVLVLLIRFVSNAVAQLLQKSTKDVLIFGLIPFIYYCYDYIVTVYSKMLYLGIEVVTEFLGFMLCIFYVLFVLVYFKEYEEKRETEQRNRLMELQRIQSEKEVEMMKRSEQAVAILRHDLRHFLSDISGYIESNENGRAQAYIREIIDKSDKTAMKKYTNNKIVNMILSSYENRILELEIDFQHSVQIPEELDFSDSDVSAILSNALENAVQAVAGLEQGKRKIELDLRVNNDKFLMAIKNTYSEKPKIIDGLPITTERGHGFGTQSIRYITEKLKGNCQFTVEDEYFVLRIVL